MDLLCNECFRYPSPWLDKQNSKTKDSLWIHAWYIRKHPQGTEEIHGQCADTKCFHCTLKHEVVSIGFQKYPEDTALVASLKACAGKKDLDTGIRLHTDILRRGLLERYSHVGNTLVNMYTKCGALAKARDVFDELPSRNVVSWNALIAGYAQQGQGETALKFFEKMQRDGLSPNGVTFVCALKACGSIGAANKGKDIHTEIVRKGLLEKDIFLNTALVDMYAKCGALSEAQAVFDKLPDRNVVSWSALIAGYAQHGQGEKALDCFEQMQHEGFTPNAITFVCVLKACGSIGAVEKGKDLHSKIVKEGLLEENVLVGNALVDMYVKCGALAKAQEVFDKLPVRTVVSWSALIAGYGQFGKVDIVFDLFKKMIGAGVKPDSVILAVVLNACSHLGLVNEGEMYFETMSTSYGIIPTLEHHTCMVDLYARAGHFDKAVSLIKRMPFYDCHPLWIALLSACWKWGNVELGRLAFEHAVQLDLKDAAAYICMSNIHAAAGMHSTLKL